MRLRPRFVTRNHRIVALVTILGIAPRRRSLRERAARGVPAAGEQVPNGLAGHGATRPPVAPQFNALSSMALVRFRVGEGWCRAVADVAAPHQPLRPLLGVAAAVYTRLNM